MAQGRSRTPVRFYSNNFQFEGQASSTDSSYTKNWKARYYSGGKKDNVKFFYDSKNSIYCANPTMDFTCYYNYMTLLNQLYDQWACYGLFDQMYKPYIYLPSFWSDSSVALALTELTIKANVNMYSTQGTSFMYHGKAIGPQEYWIHKNDLVKVLEYTASVFYDKVGLPDIGPLSLGSMDPDEVRTSQLIRVLSNIDKMGGNLPV